MKKTLLYILLTLTVNAVAAQTVYRTTFQKGSQYMKQLAMSSDEIFYRGEQVLNINAKSTLYRLYTVNDTSGDTYFIKISTKKVTDTMKSMGLQTTYSSEIPFDTTSFIARSLNRLIGKETNVVVNKSNVIESTSNNYLPNKSDSLLTFISMLPDNLITGNQFELIAKLPIDDLLKKKNKWTDSILTTYGKEIIHYTIDRVSDSTSLVSFKGTAFKTYNYAENRTPVQYNFNTNITGTMMVNNRSAIITERYTKTASSGYESINGKVISIAKRSTILETVKKL
jgi:hypothetical protein